MDLYKTLRDRYEKTNPPPAPGEGVQVGANRDGSVVIGVLGFGEHAADHTHTIIATVRDEHPSYLIEWHQGESTRPFEFQEAASLDELFAALDAAIKKRSS